MTCRWAGSDRPRILPDRHESHCRDDQCPGCAPCPEPHCRVCHHTHAEHTCAECLADARANLHDIARMCGALSDEAEHRGVEGEAMMLLGPAANPEAWGHHEASAKVGRVSAEYLADARDELHPLWVLGTWSMTWRAELDHDDDGEYDLPELVGYIDRTMGYMATWPHAPFEDFARDIRRCAGHLEAVLHDGEQVDRGAPCLRCRVPLVREWGRLAAADGWRCPRCREWRSDQDYRLNVSALHRREATELTAEECELRTGVRAGTIRVWASRGDITRRRDSGRTVYVVAEVLRRAGVAS